MDEAEAIQSLMGIKLRRVDLDLLHDDSRLRDSQAVFLHALEMQRDRLAHSLARDRERPARCNATGKIRNVRAVAGASFSKITAYRMQTILIPPVSWLRLLVQRGCGFVWIGMRSLAEALGKWNES